MKPVTQEEASGCGIACIAFLVGKNYRDVKKKLDNPEYATDRGYYCREIVKELDKWSLKYKHCKALDKNKDLIKND